MVQVKPVCTETLLFVQNASQEQVHLIYRVLYGSTMSLCSPPSFIVGLFANSIHSVATWAAVILRPSMDRTLSMVGIEFKHLGSS